MKLYLSSFRIGNKPQKLLSVFGENKKVAVIANSMDFLEDETVRKSKVEDESKALRDIGLEPEELDLRDYFGKPNELAEKLNSYDGIWVRGGNVFILRRAYKESGMDNYTYVTGRAYFNKSESIVAKHPIKNVKYKKVKKTSRRLRDREEWLPFDVPVIVNDNLLYDRIQKILDFNQKYASKKKKYNYLLSGLIYCGHGYRRSGDGASKSGHFYYRSIARLKNGYYENKCKCGGVNAVILDSMVWKMLKKKLFSYSIMRKYAEKWLKSISILNSEDVLEKQRLNEMIAKTLEEENRYSKAYGVDTLEFEQFQDLMKDCKKRRLAYQKQLSELTNKTAQINIQIEVDELLTEVMRIVKSIDFTDKFRVIRDIIDKVIVTERSGAEICGHLPLPVTITEKLGYEPIGRDCGTA